MAPEPDERLPLLSLDAAALEARVVALGGRPFHARIVREGVLQRGVLDYAELTSLPAALREQLAATTPILGGEEVERRTAPDGATKLLVAFAGKPGADAARDLVETVHIPPRDPTSGKGATLCVSTQVGCPVGCPFCASGLAGLVRNLEAWEILEQFLRGRALGALSRTVVMGIGEPLLNLAALETALTVVRDDLGLGARRITVSTVGFPERLRRAARTRPRFQLAISLHSPDQEQRDALVPAMAGVPVEDVLDAGDDWFEQTGREVTYEVVLLHGVNDTEGHAERLAARLRGRRCTVNLIPYNPVGETPYRRPPRAGVDAGHAGLAEAGVVATVRWSRGVESDAACGQLRISRT
jgi:23S rRNA (adenine2503-C2)-methyltransferase